MPEDSHFSTVQNKPSCIQDCSAHDLNEQVSESRDVEDQRNDILSPIDLEFVYHYLHWCATEDYENDINQNCEYSQGSTYQSIPTYLRNVNNHQFSNTVLIKSRVHQEKKMGNSSSFVDREPRREDFDVKHLTNHSGVLRQDFGERLRKSSFKSKGSNYLKSEGSNKVHPYSVHIETIKQSFKVHHACRKYLDIVRQIFHLIIQTLNIWERDWLRTCQMISFQRRFAWDNG